MVFGIIEVVFFAIGAFFVGYGYAVKSEGTTEKEKQDEN